MSKFAEIIDSLIAAAPPEQKSAFEAQVFLKNGAAIVGVLRKHPALEGIYIITGMGKRNEQEQVPSLKVETYFEAENVMALNQFSPIDTSGLILPNGGNGRILGIPGGLGR